MRTLIYNSSSRSSAPLQRMLAQSGLRVDDCITPDRLLYLAMVERYVAILWFQPASPEKFFEEYDGLKQAGCTTPIVVVTGRQSAYERAKALEAGVHEYYIEPFSYSALISQIIHLGYMKGLPERKTFRAGPFELDATARSATFQRQALKLSRTEFDLLSYFIRNRGSVLSRIQIWEEVWNSEEYPLVNTIDVHINRLRKKLPPEGRSAIQTVYGVGYRMRDWV